MNKAAFLNIVRQVAPIQDQEVDDLEKLVVSFPYCQTAHVLLAKAAHDRGSMLSTQKLRRAAAHASNRQLLKQLIYAVPAPPAVALPEPEEQETENTPHAVLAPFSENEAQNEVLPLENEVLPLEEEDSAHEWETEDAELEEIPDTEVPALDHPEELDALEETELEEITPEEMESVIPEDALAEEEELSSFTSEETPDHAHQPLALLPAETLTREEEEFAPASTELEAENLEELATALAEDTAEDLPEEEPSALEPFSENEPENSPWAIETEEALAEEEALAVEEVDETALSLEEDDFNLDELLELIQISSLSSLSAPIPSVNLTHEEIISEITSASEASTAAKEEELARVPVAPVEDGLSAYLEIAELYTVYDTTGYEFPTLKVNPTEALPQQETEQDPYLSIFTQNNLAYWMGSSRLGESIQLKDELTSLTPFYFQPELILEHVKSNHAPAPAPEETPAAKLDKQLFIINQFLKTTPKRKTLANTQQSQEPQEDLSAKSSKIKKNLVSENLALIFIKQGKSKKAVKIYEQLIVKFPEKKSYFAEQIEKLRNEL